MAGLKVNDTPNEDGFYHYIFSPRFQFGKRIQCNNYIHIILEPFFRVTDNAELGKNVMGLMAGVQYSWKMVRWYEEKVLIRRPRKTYMLRIYPEFLITGGLSNVSSETDLNSFKSGYGLYPVLEYGFGLNFYLNKSFNLQVSFQMIYIPHSKIQYTPPTIPFTRIIWKL